MEQSLQPARFCFDKVRARIIDGKQVVLLIGAGCSSTAEIPLAKEFIDHVRKRYPEHEAQIHSRTSYVEVMSMLSEGEHFQLLRDYVDKAKVNPTHFCIAELLQSNVARCVLTTNFDPLVVRACALMGFVPAIYDCVATSDLKRAYDKDYPAVFHLHGQVYGLGMRVTNESLAAGAHQVNRVCRDAVGERLLIVVGHGGTEDNLLERIAGWDPVDHVLWVPFSQDDANHALRVLQRPRFHVIEPYEPHGGSDGFFRDLLTHLRHKLPAAIVDPKRCSVRKQIVVPTGFWPSERPLAPPAMPTPPLDDLILAASPPGFAR